MLCEYITILDSFLFVMKSMLVIENCWTDVIYSFDWYGLSPFTIHTGLSGEDLELRHTVFWCIYPSSRGDLFIRGSTGDSNLCVYGTSETRNGRPETEEVPDVQERKWLLLSLSIGGKSDVTQKGLVRELVEFNH